MGVEIVDEVDQTSLILNDVKQTKIEEPPKVIDTEVKKPLNDSESAEGDGLKNESVLTKHQRDQFVNLLSQFLRYMKPHLD